MIKYQNKLVCFLQLSYHSTKKMCVCVCTHRLREEEKKIKQSNKLMNLGENMRLFTV